MEGVVEMESELEGKGEKGLILTRVRSWKLENPHKFLYRHPANIDRSRVLHNYAWKTFFVPPLHTTLFLGVPCLPSPQTAPPPQQEAVPVSIFGEGRLNDTIIFAADVVCPSIQA